MEKQFKKRVLVGFSGGVDSSVAAALLQEKGFDVSGIFLRFWKNSQQNYAQDEKNLSDARKVAQKLGIKLIVRDVRQEFKDEVVGYFLEGYQKGETPNPCVFCNKNLKFKFLFEEMFDQGFDFVATGHYARINRKKDGEWQLFKGADEKKDQSYFLYTLNQEELSRIIFPLGDLKKKEIRKKASQINLPVLEKKESQDICFLRDGELNGFLKENLKMKKGEIIDEKGKILGEHDGLPLYTLGQRKGIGVGGKGPYFVFEKDFERNVLKVLNQQNQKKLESKEFFLENVSWIFKEPNEKEDFLVKTRYQKKSISAIIEKIGKRVKVILEKPQRAVTEGQSAVFYDFEGKVLGGGIIKK